MSRKNNLLKYPNIVNGIMTGTAVILSSVTNIQYLDDIGLQLNWTGAAVGEFQVQVSIDYAQDNSGNVTNPGNWVPLLFTYWNGTAFVTSYDVPTTLGSPIFFDLALLSAPWIRVQYTNASGTGVLNTFITAKEIG